MSVATPAARVLVLNDDPDVVAAMRAVLEEGGYQVDTRLSRSIDDVAAVMPDLLMIDCRPGEKAEVLNFLQRVRLRRDLAWIPVLLGASSMKLLEPEMLRDRLIHVLLRPFEIDGLLEAAAELIEAGRHKRPPRPGDVTAR